MVDSPSPTARLLALCSRIRWFNLAVLVLTPTLGVYGALSSSLRRPTFLFSLFYYILSMLGITAGYHRLFSHRSYTASPPLRCLLLLAGASAVQGSCLWWSRTHRVHHRYTDTARDPYAITKGVLYAHLGWVLLARREDEPRGRAETKDLKEDAMVVWQHRWYFPLAVGMGYVLPAVIPGIGWGDWRGGAAYASLLRLTCVHHCTFLVNSLAHSLGSQSFSTLTSPRDSLITAILTLGEGYHNFHHAFPADFRAAVHAGAFDPTQWFILLCSSLGLASGLHRTPADAIHKAELHTTLEGAKALQDALLWPKPVDALPVWTWTEYKEQTKGSTGSTWLLVSGIIHDVRPFVLDHPGGEKVLVRAAGSDATQLFLEGTHAHSQAAQDMLSMMRVARLEEDDKMDDKAMEGADAKKQGVLGQRLVVVEAREVGRG